MQDTKNIWIIVGVAAVVLLVGTYLLATPGGEPTPPATVSTSTPAASGPATTPPPAGSSKSSTERVLESDRFTLSNNVTYTMERFAVINASGTTVRTDQRLVSDAAGKRTVLIPSVKTALPELGAMGLKLFVVRKNPELVVFVSALFGSDAPYGSFYRLDMKTLHFSALPTASRFIPYQIDPTADAAVFSADKTEFLSIYDRNNPATEARQLYLVDVANDQVRAIASVASSESLSQYITADQVPVGVYQWMGNTVSYSVFNASDPLSSEAGKERTATAVRTVSINPDSK